MRSYVDGLTLVETSSTTIPTLAAGQEPAVVRSRDESEGEQRPADERDGERQPDDARAAPDRL